MSSANIKSEISVGSLHLRIKEMKCLISTVFVFSSVSSCCISSIFVSSSACSSSYCFISCLYCLSGSKPETRFSYKPRMSLESSSYRFWKRSNSDLFCFGFSVCFSFHKAWSSFAKASSSFRTNLDNRFTADNIKVSTLSALIEWAEQEFTLLAYPPQR